MLKGGKEKGQNKHIKNISNDNKSQRRMEHNENA